ncbi:dipeptide ABC transporter ATP-binding protein [Anaerocolumna sp. MB42-C2]|uniref:dipeptide ABC transporter ATP-binding protein n=1 Tax=Anaerocolumna sp. MB42-C2 TaxID=3070997 RepID=UPI0027DFCFB4|nr:ABC transporter ATP-binding protein [Anaerocolumna sp. MB42-C2]WMJ85968.1 ABC transporter ATP-binding protein [Anaerocolumna sp. MB42-C2]
METNQKKADSILDINQLTIGFYQKGNINKVVNNVSFKLQEGEILGIVGESGSGKTMTALAVMGLLSKSASVLNGSIVFAGSDLLKLNNEELRKLKGKQEAMIFQEPMTSLNPVMIVGSQIEEMLILHESELKADQRKERVLSALTEAGLTDAKTLFYKYPHQLSGGMRQRVMIAMAMILKPQLLIADEPTTALDVTIQAQILSLIQTLSKEYGVSVLLISHDLGVIQKICNRAIVMQNGEIVEEGLISALFKNPEKEYTKNLIAARTELLMRSEDSSSEANNIDEINQSKRNADQSGSILEVQNLSVFYEEKGKKLFEKKRKKQVVKNVSFYINSGEVLGIVGESGSGKSTLAKAVVGLIKSKTGEINLKEAKPQMVFQDPYGSLNPAKKISWILEEPLRLAKDKNSKERKKKVLKILREVGLDESYADRYLSELSGGQRQRVAIGAALIQNSKFIVLDEPVSALDVTVQAQILELLKKLQKEYNLTYLFISHDLNVIHRMCDRVCVMYRGELVETASAESLFHNPKHPYSQKLLDAVL